MPASRGKRAPARARGLPCSQCGADKWKWTKTRGEWRCWPCALKRRRESHARIDKADPAGRLWRAARSRTRASGVEFAITIADVRQAWPRENRCPALGIPLRQGKGAAQDASPSLDRINPAWGYVPGNIAVISYAANRAKGNLAAAQLSRIADWMRAAGLA